MNLQSVFNGPQPSVVVDCTSHQDQSGGDLNAHKGLARHIANLLGAKYSEITYDQCPDGAQGHLKSLMEGDAPPDFIFTKQPGLDPCCDSSVQSASAGLVIASFSENLVRKLMGYDPVNYELVPHHLEAKTVDWQRDIFAREYAELPRPLVGVFLTGEYTEHDRSRAGVTANSIALTLKNEGTVFLCSSRHNRKDFAACSDFFRERIGNQAMFVDFNLNAQREAYGAEESWNPYIGLLASADHLVVFGNGSSSIVSEAVSMGKNVHMLAPDYEFPQLAKRGYLTDIHSRKSLQTRLIEPIGINDSMAKALICKHAEVVQSIRCCEKKPDGVSSGMASLGRYPTI